MKTLYFVPKAGQLVIVQEEKRGSTSFYCAHLTTSFPVMYRLEDQLSEANILAWLEDWQPGILATEIENPKDYPVYWRMEGKDRVIDLIPEQDFYPDPITARELKKGDLLADQADGLVKWLFGDNAVKKRQIVKNIR